MLLGPPVVIRKWTSQEDERSTLPCLHVQIISFSDVSGRETIYIICLNEIGDRIRYRGDPIATVYVTATVFQESDG
ncbi:Hypothetical predicted protein [Mytilus galloprovincialis]|uniref:Uncharacterized protein n=1 Tax=Mytilus galloprovincialis TaxID=29158 RepID=A0A8B6DCM2_MYTGA|nr:Hypothetical predicted protein [Mytilus galloprovincialis]